MNKKDVLLEQKIIDSIKALALDMIDAAGSGHPGIVLGAAPIIYTLYARHLMVNPLDSKWLNRDRFILSAGHGSALLYATLFMAGFKLTVDDLKAFRRLNSKTPGHPEYNLDIGVEMTTGPLGQGFASAVGMAIGERFLASKYNIKKKGVLDQGNSLFDYYTYVLCSDGDLMEGVSYEAASLAGTLSLSKLIVLYDSNNVSLDGNTNLTFNENVIKRFDALGWHTELVKNGDNIDDLNKAIIRAKKSIKPSLIEVKTIIGKGSSLASSNKVHGSPLPSNEIIKLKTDWGIRDIPFAVSKEVVLQFKDLISNRITSKYQAWQDTYQDYLKQFSEPLKLEIERLNKFDLAYDLDLPNFKFEFDKNMNEALRVTNGKIMNVIADKISNLVGGNADLASSTKAFLNNYAIFNRDDYSGRNLYFGVREHAMGAILNGITLSGIRSFGGTFLTFADYMKPAIRMSALMNLPVIYIFTHDSINIGPDGPTHQPIEQLAMLRSIPNLSVFRPADAKEIAGAWQTILKKPEPSALVLSRQEVPLLPETSITNVEKGAYMVKKEAGKLLGVIIATGSEVSIALTIAKALQAREINLRVISMPSIELFLRQTNQYREDLIPIGYKTVVIEAGSSLGWHRFVYSDKYLMTIDQFGLSGKTDEIQKHLEFNLESLTKKIEHIFK